MTFHKIIWKMLKVNYKRYVLYLACNIFAVLFLFLFYTISFNREVEEMKRTDSFDTLLAIPTAALILFMLFFILYSHQMFIKNRKSEFGIFMAIGMTPRNITRLLITESFFISSLALLIGLIVGSVLSKLFFHFFSYFTNISPNFFHISIKMVTFTVLVYIILYWAATIFTVIQIRNQSLLSTIQSKQVIDLTKTNHTLFGIFGIGFIIVSILGLFLTYPEKEDLLFIWALLSFFGLYLYLSNGIHATINVIKKKPSFYYQFILLFSSIQQKQKKLTSLLTLISIMVMITTFYCTIALFIAKYEYEDMLKSNPSDVAYLETDTYNQIAKDELYSLFAKEHTPITNLETIPTIQIAKEDYYGTNYYNVINLTRYNELINRNVRLDENECILFVNIRFPGEINDDEPIELGQFSFKIKDTKVGPLLSHIGQTSTFIVVKDNIWEQFKDQFPTELYYQHHIFVDDWKNSLPAIQQLKAYFTEHNPDMNEEIKHHYAISSKIEIYTINKTENAILFYVLSFLSVLFYTGMFILLYLNLMSDIDLERSKFDKLSKIGITKQEIKQQFNSETFILFFLPTFLGIFLALLYIMGMSKDVGGVFNNLNILGYFFIMCGIYLVIQFCFYFYSKSRLFSKVWSYLNRNSN